MEPIVMTVASRFPSPPIAPPLDASLTVRLQSVAHRIRRYVALEGVAWLAAFLLVSALVQFAIDYGTRGLRLSIRAALLAIVLVGAGWTIRRFLVIPLRVRFGPAEVANLIERRFPQLSSGLISAVRFAAGEVGPADLNSPALVSSVIRRAGGEGAGIDFDVVLNPQRARRSGFALASLLAVCVILSVAAPDTVSRWLARNLLLMDVPWPKRTMLVISIEGDELIGARGDDLVIEARADGVQPRQVEILFETASGKRGRETMTTVGGGDALRYRYVFKNAQEDFTFHLEGGDDETNEFRTRLLDRPAVVWSELRLQPPAYTRLDPFTLGDGERAGQVLPGSEVTISVKTNKPVVQAELLATRERIAEVTREGEVLRATFSPKETHTYHFRLVDEAGLDDRRPARFSLRVVADDPPRGRMKLSGAGAMITPEAVLPIELEFTDAYGLGAIELIYRTAHDGSGREESIPLPQFHAGATTFSTSVRWAVADASVVPGDTLTLFMRATDQNDVSGPGSFQSPDVTLRIVTKEELLAELARREQEYRLDFERMVNSQEQLRSGLLTALGRFRPDSPNEQLAGELTPLERRQRNITGSVGVVRQHFEQILAELAVNQLDTLDERKRLGEGIVDPLTQLSRRDLISAADTIRQWSRDAAAETASQVDPQQVSILSQMRAVLSNMVQWEGYQEVVHMLRDIIRLQQELRNETKNTLQEKGHEVFDD